MVRVAGGVRITSGKALKKGSSGNSSSGASTSGTSKPSSSGSSSRLPPITHQETPAWQKPITNFFSTQQSPLKNKSNLPPENATETVLNDDEPPSDNDINNKKNTTEKLINDNEPSDNISNKENLTENLINNDEPSDNKENIAEKLSKDEPFDNNISNKENTADEKLTNDDEPPTKKRASNERTAMKLPSENESLTESTEMKTSSSA